MVHLLKNGEQEPTAMKDQDQTQREHFDRGLTGPGHATGRRGGSGDDYNEGPIALKGSEGTTMGVPDRQEDLSDRQEEMDPVSARKYEKDGPWNKSVDAEWRGGTPEQGPTSGGMGAAGGGHDTDDTDVWSENGTK